MSNMNSYDEDKKSEYAPVGNMKKQTWKRSFDYLLCLLGVMVGYGNVWRFPYLCYKHGGGAFLVAYCSFVIFLVFPLIFLEMSLGQYFGKSPLKAWSIVPLFKGLGYSVLFLLFYCNTYYPLLLTWTLRWLVASFSTDMPWTKCNNYWNTENCLPLFQILPNSSTNSSESHNVISPIVSNNSFHEMSSSVEEFWNNYILGITDGIENIGGINMELFYCFNVIWIACYFSIWKGISWTSKIVYVTATLPFAMIVVVLIRGVTLEGAGDGIIMYLKLDISRLANIELWVDAASQVLYSTGPCTGVCICLSSYNKFHHNFLRDSIIITSLNAAASFLSGFAIFSVLGFLAHAQNTTVDAVSDSGPGLVFIAYPTALSLLPLPHMWLALFFIMLIFLGFDSFFVFQETLIACIKEKFPGLYTRKWSAEVVALVVCLVNYICGVVMTTYGGIYIFNIFNTYAITGWCRYFLTMCEAIAIGWIYGADRMCDNIEEMLRRKIPRFWFKLCWKCICPCISLVLMIYSLISYQPLKHDRSYVYPKWADGIGWVTALSSILCVPVAAVYVLWNAGGKSLKEKFRSSMATPLQFQKPRKTTNKDELIELSCKESL